METASLTVHALVSTVGKIRVSTAHPLMVSTARRTPVRDVQKACANLTLVSVLAKFHLSVDALRMPTTAVVSGAVGVCVEVTV
jgi:hypothetical protein